MDEMYWVAKKGDELAQEIAEKVHAFQEYTKRNTYYQQWIKNRSLYENRIFGQAKDQDIIDCGDVGELKAVSFNHFRNILRHVVNAHTSKVPAYDVTARNTTLGARRSAKIGKDIVKYYYNSKRLSRYIAQALEFAVVDGDGYVAAEYNPMIGRTVMVDENNKPIKEGDFEFEALSSFDVYFDFTKKTKENWQWVIIRRRKNKYDLAKIFPAKKQEILARTYDKDRDLYGWLAQNTGDTEKDATDDIWVYSTYHRATPTVKNGKFVLSIGNGGDSCVLYEGENPYRDDLPIFPIASTTYLDRSFGFTDANILRGPQIMLADALSYIFSDMEAFGTKNIWSQGDVTVEQITGGLNLIKSDVEPKPISLSQENPGLYNFLNLCISTMETLSAQNAVVRGNVKDTPNLKSGVALATVINMAQQYSQALEKNYLETFEDLTSFILKHLKKVATDERFYEISGRGNRSYIATFKGDDLKDVGRVIVEQVNPIAKTAAGQVEIAMEMLKMQNITSRQFFDVVNTGNLNNVMESDERMFDYICAVKERLLEGKKVVPIPGIDHKLLIEEVQSLLYDIDMTSNPQNAAIVQNVTDLINGHMTFVRNGDEIAALIYGGQPPQPTKIMPQETIQPEGGEVPPMAI